MTKLRPLRNPALLATLAVALIVLWHAPHYQHITSDTFSVLSGVGVIDHCLHAHNWRCGNAGYGDIGPSALLQYLPGLAFKRLRMSYQDAAHGLVWVNTISYLLLLLVLWRTGRRLGDRRLSALLVLLAAASPLLWYSSSGFGEGFGVLLVTSFTCALVVGARGLVLGVTLWLAAISKEPALPFLLALAFVVLRRPVAEGVARVRRGQLIGLAVGAVAALATNIAFNAFRATGSVASGARPLSSSLSHVAAPAPTLVDKAEAFFGLFLAPNAGLLWFWPLALGAVALGLVTARRRAGSWRSFVDTPAFGALVVFVLFVAGTAWYVAPYGFAAFGPRYLVPWVLSFAIVALADWEGCLETLSRLRSHRRATAALAVVAIVLAVSQLASFLNPTRAYGHFAPGGDCPIPLEDITSWYQHFGEVDSYYRCTNYLAWAKTPILAKVDAELGSPASAAYALVYVAALGAFMITALGVDRARQPA